MEKIDGACPECGNKQIYRRSENLLTNVRARKYDDKHHQYVCLGCESSFGSERIGEIDQPDADSIFGE